MFIIPAAQISLYDAMVGLLPGEWRPAMRRGIQRLDLVRIVSKKLSERAPVIAVLFLHEAGHPRRHGNDPVLAHQLNRFAVYRSGASFVNGLQRGIVGALQ